MNTYDTIALLLIGMTAGMGLQAVLSALVRKWQESKARLAYEAAMQAQRVAYQEQVAHAVSLQEALAELSHQVACVHGIEGILIDYGKHLEGLLIVHVPEFADLDKVPRRVGKFRVKAYVKRD